MDKENAKRFLLGQRIRLEEWKVRKLVMDLPYIMMKKEGYSLRSFYHNPEGRSLMGKGTAYKIKDLFEQGNLDPYLHYLDANKDWHSPVGEKQSGGLVRGLLSRWVAGLGEEYLREILIFVHFLGLLPEELMASAKELILPLECKIPRESEMSLILASNLHDMGHIDF